MQFSIVALGLSTGFALVALVTATLALRRAHQLARWQSWPYEKIAELESIADEHAVQLAQHHERLRKVNARLAARDRRAGHTPDESHERTPADSSTGFARQPGESDLDWKRRMRAALATGAMKHG